MIRVHRARLASNVNRVTGTDGSVHIKSTDRLAVVLWLQNIIIIIMLPGCGGHMHAMIATRKRQHTRRCGRDIYIFGYSSSTFVYAWTFRNLPIN